MPNVESLESIEKHLSGCRDLSSSIGENILAYMIDMAIVEARERAARDREDSQVHWAHASARVAPTAQVKRLRSDKIKVG